MGTATVEGRPATRIRLNADPATIFDIDSETYEPLRFEQTGPNGDPYIGDFEIVEYLPPTDANRRLLSIHAQHPIARALPVARPSTP